MKVIRITCDDRYEAEKLAAMTSVQKDGSVFVEAVRSIIGKEVILTLKDKSSHSIMVKEHEDLESLKHILKQVALGRLTIVSSSFSGNVAEITLTDFDAATNVGPC